MNFFSSPSPSPSPSPSEAFGYSSGLLRWYTLLFLNQLVNPPHEPMVDPIVVVDPIHMVDPIPMVNPKPMVDPTLMLDPTHGGPMISIPTVY